MKSSGLGLGPLTEALRSGRLSAAEVVEAHLVRLTELNEQTNCVAASNADAAQATAAALDQEFRESGPVGPLHGVPFTVKDWVDVEGLACTGGEVEHARRRPKQDASVVARLRAAGAVVLAKTAVQVESELFGKVRNPHDLGRSPGGSSSGEAVAVAGGGSPLGVGSDSGGSIRVPAAWCGVAGLKPSAGRVPLTGHFPRLGALSDGRTQIGPLAGSASALGSVLRVIAGPDGRDAGVAPVPLESEDAVDVSGLRVAWAVGEPGWEPVDAVKRAVEQAAAALEAGGARLVGAPPHHLDEALDITMRYWGRRFLSGDENVRLLWDWDRFQQRMLTFVEDVDAMVLPVTLDEAPPHRDMRVEDYIFTLPASLTGAPALVVPAGSGSSGLPIGVQIIGRRWEEHVVLAVGTTIERIVSG